MKENQNMKFEIEEKYLQSIGIGIFTYGVITITGYIILMIMFLINSFG